MRLNTTQAEQKLKRLSKAIDAVNNVARRQSNAYNAVNNALKTSETRVRKTKVETDKLANSANKVNTNFRRANATLGTFGSRLKAIASAYLGVQSMRLVIETSDTITSAQNKLNNLDSNSSPKATAEAMDKMYSAAQRSRSSYTEMMSNVSKSMMLAGDSFDNSIDNAIRFQEIMAKAYTVGGATAQEQHSSMYQLVQALGSGTLAGDELRSVREGAPLAYKAIEKFAQKTLNSTESLKDLASQGVITADMVVAAVMDAGDDIEKKFNNTKMTFAQGWDAIKNMAVRAFSPVSEMLQNELQQAVEGGAMKSLEQAFINISKALQITFKILINVTKWVIENWGEIRNILISVATVMSALWAAEKIMNLIAWLQIGGGWVIFFAIAIYSLVKPILDVLTGVKSLCDAIVEHLWIVGAGLLVLALLLGNWWVALAAVIVIVLGVILKFIEYVLGGITWLGILFKNVGLEIANFFIALSWVVANAFMTAVEFVVDVFNDCVSWIGALFSNLWQSVISGFWNFIADLIDGLDWLAKPLESIAKLFGKSFDYETFSQGIRDKANAAQGGFQDGWSSEAWNKGTSKWTAPKWDENSSWSEKINTFDTWGEGWGQDAFDIGYGWGEDFKGWINKGGDKAQGWFDDKFSLDSIGEKLGLNFDEIIGDGSALFPGDIPLDPYSSPALDELLGEVGDINDKMDLGDDDLDYLRKIAEMEWRKEFTTAEIKVDMTNYNAVNGERDLDGIVTYLSDVLREEMSNVAYGVHY